MGRLGERLKSVLPVRLYGMDGTGKAFNVMVRTVDISPSGARLQGVELALQPGDIVGLQYGVEKARCRVVWVGEHQDTNAQVGLTMLQPAKRFWGVDFSNSADTFTGAHKIVPADAAGPRPERRLSRRYPCDIGTELVSEGTATLLWGRCTDISSGGCYVETRSPVPKGSRFHIRLRSEIAPFQADCVVCSFHPLLGMGLHFEDMSQDDARALGKILVLGTSSQPAPTASPSPAIEPPPPEIAQLQRLLMTLNSITESAPKCFSDAGALAAFRQAIHAATSLTADVESAYQQGGGKKSLSAAMPVAVLKYRTKLLAEIGSDLGNTQNAISCGERDIEQLRSVLRTMEENLRHLVPNRNDASRPIPPDIIQFPAKSSAL
jgi:hypothetical protein